VKRAPETLAGSLPSLTGVSAAVAMSMTYRCASFADT
jgi:hypothetical protein